MSVVSITSSRIAACGLWLAACGSLSSCGDKDPAAELAKLKSEQASTQARISELETATGASEAEAALQATPVSVIKVATESFNSYLEVQGRVDFDQNATVAARAAGTLTTLSVKRGDQVRKGQTLATVDGSVLDANVAELKVRMDLAKVIYEKQKRLWDQQIGTEIQFLQARNNYRALQSNLATLNQQRDLYRVVAPFGGTVDDVLPKLGESVAPGTPVVKLLSSSGNGKIVVDVSEAYANSIKVGDKALVTIPDLGETELNATVRVVTSTINPISRTFTVELRLADPSKAGRLRPNMVTNVRIENYNRQDATVLPVDLVQRDEQNSYVLVVDDKGGKKVAAKRVIQVGNTYNGKVEVTQGLQTGDQVISAGYQSLNEGQTVSL